MSSLKVVNGEICYLSQEDDQTYGMWCPVSYDTRHQFKEGDVLTSQDENDKRIAELEKERDALVQAGCDLCFYANDTEEHRLAREKFPCRYD